MVNEYSMFLQTSIKPWCRPASGGRVVNCRCFYCSDSKNMNHGHFYISIPQSDDELSLFYCQKCKVGGVVTPEKLIEWNIFNSDISSLLTDMNRKAMLNPNNFKYTSTGKYNLRYDYISTDDLSSAKLAYINSRLGTSLNYIDCINMKIVLNLSDLFKTNYYLKRTRANMIIDQLDAGFIGFLSFDNAFLNMRKFTDTIVYHKSIDKRYVNYNIMDKYDNTCRFYCIPNTIDLMQPIHLHVAEGPFDILSIYYNIATDHNNHVFCAVGGSGYKGLIRYFINVLKTPNLIIHVYPDNDQDRNTIIDISDYLYPFGYQFYIHRNIFAGEKDFGVPKDRIQEVIERVK